MKVRTGRTLFNETWLSEMPNGINTAGVYNQLVSDINEKIQIGVKIIKLPNNLNKIEGKQTMFYWYGDKNNIILGCEIEILPYMG
jgi:hypothetical protein